MPVNENVNIKVSADMAQAIQAWKEIADGPLALERALKKISELEGQRSKGLARELSNVVGQWASIGAMINAATKALRFYFDTAQRLREESVNATRDIDTASRQYFISAGIKPGTPQGAQAIRNITTMAQTAGATPAGAFAGARMLAEFGATTQQQQGGALRELLDLQDVMKIGGKEGDAEQLSRAVLEVLKRSQQPITGPSVRALGGTAVQLTGAGTGFGPGQIQEFARVAKVATDAGLDMPTALSMWAALREAEEPRIARTKYRALLDKKELPGEAAQRAALRKRGVELMATAATPYDEALAIAGGAMVEAEQVAGARYDVSGFATGALDAETVRKNMISAIRDQYGKSPAREAMATAMFNLRNLIGGPEYAINTGFPDSGMTTREVQANQKIRERALGRENFNINIKLKTPDGRDIPHEVEAIGIQER